LTILYIEKVNKHNILLFKTAILASG
jgi:hypothetical protein